MSSEILFVIEGTAINGAYINDMKSNYIIPTLEYFSQSTVGDCFGKFPKCLEI